MRGGFGRRMTSEAEKDFSLKELDRETLKFLFSYLKAYKLKIAFAVLAMLMVSLASLAAPYLSKIAVDDYIAQGDLSGLNLIALLIVLSYLVFWLFSYHQTYLANYIGQHVIAEIRDDLYQHLQTLSMRFYTKESTGNVMSTVTHDVNALTDLLSTGFIHLLNDFFTISGIMIVMLYLDYRLALLSFIVIPFVIFTVRFLGKRMRSAYSDVRQKLAELNADVEENLSGIRLIQALNREAKNEGEFKNLSWKNFKANLAAASYFALLFPLMELAKVLGEAIVLAAGGAAVISGRISLGIIIAFMAYVRRFFAPLADLSQVYNTYQSAGAALDRINNYFKADDILEEIDKEESLIIKNKLKDDFKAELKFKNVSFAYEKEKVIDNLNLEIKAGEVFALVGETGAGKSTLAKLLARLYDLDEGELLISEINIKNIPFDILRKKIAVVPQNVFLFNSTILENIRYAAPNASQAEVEAICGKINADQFIKKMPKGYQTEVGENGVKLSGGQKQLLSFARAMLVDPKILILDEATSSVDLYTEKIIQEGMDELLSGRTVLIIAHRFATLKKAERIGVMKEGRLIDSGSHQKLLKENEIYKELVNKQLLNNE
ncbi:ABC transporter ATP-binding protein/permease [Halanaerobium sp. Z-7514]|uniref:ABC transporter ATP-binding protein/permease n=1 Tax=Halanaerobium polyolivorans TaxID=2886943 RepID=A0AAW4WYD3_9FIRM|nr:ABC transporter ATP-binding protein [Halanaerobium polyolivorans]MCC3145128.1 ABC transporter ATP-binding protein/permease [Halanaerobium polyolivorans]